jgi:WD40 repeat protein
LKPRVLKEKTLIHKSRLIGMLLLAGMLFVHGCQKADFPTLKGPYLGQQPPGLMPKVFAPGIISLEDRYELNSEFSPKGDEFYFELSTSTPEEKEKGVYFYVIMASRLINGVWTKPEIAPFSGEYATMDHCFSPDGNRLYFTSDRPNSLEAKPKNNIWYVERTDRDWSNPMILGPPVYSPEIRQGQVAIAANGSMYFRTGDDLFYSEFVDGRFTGPSRLPDTINSPYAESKPYIAPDESFLLFVRYGMPVSFDGGRGLYISCRNEDGTWNPARNTGISGSLPKFSPDGRHFFFSRGGDIYWVDADVIYSLKSRETK